MVINTAFQKNEPDVRIGDTIRLRLGGHETHWRVVGVVRMLLAESEVYVNQPFYERAAEQVGRASWMWVRTASHDSLLALPLGKLLSDAVGIAFVQTPFSYTFSTAGVVIWLGLVIGLPALATIRDALAYE